jgi:hypothetical protein
MAIDLSGLRAIALACRFWPMDWSRTLMLGRQEVFFSAHDVQFLRERLDWPPAGNTVSSGGFAEQFFRSLGANQLDSLDASAYEGASIVADMNRPLPEHLRGSYTALVDFGTIEHVFNLAAAVKNIASVVAERGHVLILTQSNGFSGHGLYQLSPEFFYSSFSTKNGFERTAVFLVDLKNSARWYFMQDPRLLRRRHVIPSGRPFYVICIATKRSEVDEIVVQQSDYELSAWSTTNYRHGQGRIQSGILRALQSAVGPVRYQDLRQRIHGWRADRDFLRRTPRFDPERIKPDRFEAMLKAHDT